MNYIVYEITTGKIASICNVEPDTLYPGDAVLQTEQLLEVGKGYRVNLTTKTVEEIPSTITIDPWIEVRTRRDALLTGTDYLVQPDYPISEERKAEVFAYRKALRDLPNAFATPDAVVWPTRP